MKQKEIVKQMLEKQEDLNIQPWKLIINMMILTPELVMLLMKMKYDMIHPFLSLFNYNIYFYISYYFNNI